MPFQVPPTRRLVALLVRGVGLLLLLIYLSTTPWAFEVKWVGAYVLILLGLGMLYVVVISALPNYFETLPTDTDFDLFRNEVIEPVRSKPLKLLWALAEDGFVLVPLIWVGISIFGAAIAGFVFGALHYASYPLRACIFKAVFYFLVAVLVLPHGLIAVLAGHLLVDSVLFFGISPLVQRNTNVID